MALVTKSFSDIITFTRTGTTATYFNSAGVLTSAGADVPRFDYNPSTLAAQGLLIEEQRTNLRTYSDAITVANSYGINNATLSTVAISTPMGTAASTLVLNAGANTGNNTDGFNFSSAITLTNSTAYAQSVFAKSFGSNVLRLRSNVSGLVVSFTLTGNGTAPSATSDLTSAAIQNVGNGWYRCSWTFTTTAAAPGNRGDYWTIKTDVADGVNGIYVTGAQLEAGAFPTSYIPTTVAQVTRNADQASVNTLSPWYNATAGTLFVQGIIAGGTAATFPRMSTLAGSNPNNDDMGVVWGANAGSMRWSVRAGGATQADVVFSLPKSAGASFKVAGRYAANDFQAAFDGNLGTQDTTGSVPTITSLLLGGPASFQPGANVWLQRVTFYPRGLSNAELQAITA